MLSIFDFLLKTRPRKGYDKCGGGQGYNQGGMMQEGDFEYQQDGAMAAT